MVATPAHDMVVLMNVGGHAGAVACHLRASAPEIARKSRPGQFVLLRVTEEGERIPLTVAHADAVAGTIDLIVQQIGLTTQLLCKRKAGDALASITGPLGNPTPIGEAKQVLCVGGGVGTAVLLPQVEFLSNQALQPGVAVDVIIGGRSKPYVICEDILRAQARNTWVCTDDGSYGEKGFVTTRPKALLELPGAGGYDLVIAVGPPGMMRADTGG